MPRPPQLQLGERFPPPPPPFVSQMKTHLAVTKFHWELDERERNTSLSVQSIDLNVVCRVGCRHGGPRHCAIMIKKLTFCNAPFYQLYRFCMKTKGGCSRAMAPPKNKTKQTNKQKKNTQKNDKKQKQQQQKTNKNMRQGLQNNGFETKSCACCSDHRTVLIWLRSKTFGDSRSRNCTKKQSQMLKKWSVTVQKIETLWRVISYKLMAQACQLESTSELIDKKANLTAKYRSVCSSDIVVLLYYIGFVGLLFPCNVKQWTSFSIWFEWPDRDSDREYICLSVTFFGLYSLPAALTRLKPVWNDSTIFLSS